MKSLRWALQSQRRGLGRLKSFFGVRLLPSSSGRSLTYNDVHAAADRAGSVLVAVLWLLALLWVLGMLFFVFSGREESSAKWFSDAAKADQPALDVDPLFQKALRQLILGADVTQRNSALFSGKNALGLGRHSILAHVLGNDFYPRNGRGINLITTDAPADRGRAFVDQDYDGVPDADQSLLLINYSDVANGGMAWDSVAGNDFANLPAPDVDYTYSGINALFLAHDGFAPDNSTPPVFRRVIIPSFHRPQMLREDIPEQTIVDWDKLNTSLSGDTTDLQRRVLRPHALHRYADGTFRYLGPDGIPSSDDFPFPYVTGSQQGLWTWTGNPVDPVDPYVYDADNDGDGVNEGIYVDLGCPPMEAADGTKFIPIFSITVFDADALLNLNVVGNSAGAVTSLPIDHPLFTTSVSASFRDGKPFSKSNQALSPSELNPLYALSANPASSADPATELRQHRGNFDREPSHRLELANMELLWLQHGRGEYEEPVPGTFNRLEELPGRYGDIDRLKNLLDLKDGGSFPAASGLPQPGLPNVDDDGDLLEGEGDLESGSPFIFPFPVPGFGHPLDFSGGGTYVNNVIGDFGQKPLKVGLGVGPNRWIQYIGYQDRGTLPPAGIRYNRDVATVMTSSTPNATLDGTRDEPDELITEDAGPAITDEDERFGPEEMAALHKNDGDPDAGLVASRARSLMPFNFQFSLNAPEIRSRFTTISWDRLQYNPPSSWNRSWEYVNLNDPSLPTFPPQVDPANLDPAPGFGVEQPFRKPLRQLLEVLKNNVDPSLARRQGRLDINRHLVGTRTNPVTGILEGVYRGDDGWPNDGLTPHADDPGNAVVTAPPNNNAASVVPFPPTTAAQQEHWARLDRQRMARDIYEMLYMFCGGQDQFGVNGFPGAAGDDDLDGIVNFDPITGEPDPDEIGLGDDRIYTGDNSVGAGRLLYSDTPPNDQLREMAQFAVNYVDALDSDDVITAFAYDKNLGDGWNIDNDPYANIIETDDRGLVYGVESQQLTFSEAAVVISKQVFTDPMTMTGPVDHAATRYDDSLFDRVYTCMELRNTSLLNVDLTRGSWQIRYDPDGTAANERLLTIKPTLAALPATRQVDAGRLYTITTSNGHDVDTTAMTPFHRPSDFIIDWQLDATFDTTDRIIPASPTNPFATVDQPATNLDLVHADHETYFTLTDGNFNTLPGADAPIGPPAASKGQFLTVADPTTVVTLRLRRRLHLNRAAPIPLNAAQEADNPWIEVDTMTFFPQDFQLAVGDTDLQVQDKVNNVRSRERRDPLSRNPLPPQPTPVANVNNIWDHDPGNIVSVIFDQQYGNSFGGTNQATNDTALNNGVNGEFRLWQPHFDRDFASTMELLSIPLIGPDQLTNRLEFPSRNTSTTTLPKMGIDTTASSAPRLAQEKFLFPEFLGPGSPDPQLDNRWYRLFEFLEVPTRTNRDPRITQSVPRVPGKLNLNTLRHNPVLAAMVDDPRVHNESLRDRKDARNWWIQFLQARDAVVPSDGTPAGGLPQPDPLTGLFLPGVAGTRPFRSFAYLDHGNLSIEHTLLRSLPFDQNVLPFHPLGERRRLFEIGSHDNHDDHDVDYYTRHRLLSKVANQSTTRSHVFIVYITVEFFEVGGTKEQPQIGGKLSGSPGHRAFAIIDASRPEDALIPTPPGDPIKFDYKKLIRHYRIIQ